jgi:hypothetical protein
MFSLLLASLIGFSRSVQAQILLFEDTTQNYQKQAKKPKIPNNGAPTGRRRAGAGRNPDCPSSLTKLTALVPGDGKKSFLASTIAQHPTFWFYVPELPETARGAELVLQMKDANQVKNIYRKPLTLSGKPGIISITPAQQPQYSLKENKTYHWYFHIYCGDMEKTSDNFYVDGFVQKIPLNQALASQFKTAKQNGKYIADAITDLGQQRRANPQNAKINQEWVDLLNAVGLQDLAKEPIIEHYNLEK